ncbi:PRA1 family protein H isoform X2 [Impatiens glandulifera]|uniref:PRA1 family protein H isoform X2 n=1 Tax=Impatiens glandulifera TaxID=253017 RepID=UPI001FB0979D|nr:PRA1 family protein H isoform X2 [Impatiens glandulifera]
MVFSKNPLSLSVPEEAFESWLRDGGYLEILDQRTSDLHRLNSSTPPVAADPSSSSSSHNRNLTASSSSDSSNTFISTHILPFLSRFWVFISLFTLNPFSKLTTEDFSRATPSWTHDFFGFIDSYSFPASPSQAQLRVHENPKRYARNYAYLYIIFFACSLYQMPIALVGLLSCLAIWDALKFSSERWGLDQYPSTRRTLVLVAQCGTNKYKKAY